MPSNQILDNLSSHLKNIIARAISMSASMRHEQVSILHMILSTLEEPGAVARDILIKNDISKEKVYKLLNKRPKTPITGNGAKTTVIPELDINAKKALEKGMLAAYQRGHNYVGSEHLLYGILKNADQDLNVILRLFNISKGEIIAQTAERMENTTNFTDLAELDQLDADRINPDGQSPQMPAVIPWRKLVPPNQQKKPKATDLFTVHLTSKKRQKSIDPVIGRQTEIDRIINILCRRTKNNPILIGEPGVGKTAIIEGLAKKITLGQVPDILKNKKIYSLDLTLLISGTIYRGEFEARLKQILDEFADKSNHFLFIDEIHNIIGTGGGQGTMDAANILKPALARGQLRCLGATTIDEYQRHIVGDPALERRFQGVQIKEPTKKQAVEILNGIKKYYEQYHHTTILESAIESAVGLSNRYIHDNFLPDKAIDLIDEAAAAVKVKAKTPRILKVINETKQKIKKLNKKKEKAIKQEQFSLADEIKHKVKIYQDKLADLKLTDEYKDLKNIKQTVTNIDVAGVLSSKIQIDPSILLQNEWERLKNLSSRISKKIIGQDRALNQISRSLRQAHLGITDETGPLSSLLFTGPSGVGKTETAKVLARELFFEDDALIRLNMSEFSEAHGVSKLLGSPAGYVGYRERNHFLDKIKNRPYCLILFDEFDKAHIDVRKLLLQILDDGELTSSIGKKISFKHSIVVLTSSVGAQFYNSGDIGFDKDNLGTSSENIKIVEDKLKEELGSDLLGRLNNICHFTPLSIETVQTIAQNQVNELLSKLAQKTDLRIRADIKALQSMANESLNPDTGARHLSTNIEKILHELIDEKLSRKITSGNFVLTQSQGQYLLLDN